MTTTKKFVSLKKQTAGYKDLTKMMQRYNSSSVGQDDRKERTYKVMRIEGNRAVTEEDMELQDIVTFGGNEFYARDFLSFNITPDRNGSRPGEPVRLNPYQGPYRPSCVEKFHKTDDDSSLRLGKIDAIPCVAMKYNII